MQSEKALALVVRTTDWSETSRIATLWTRELGKVRALAKGGRRLRSNFEVALDLLTICSIVLIRKNSGLELLTEARAEERFPGLRTDLKALYTGYYIAELLGEGTQDNDPHPLLFDETLTLLRRLDRHEEHPLTVASRFDLVWLRELGYRPQLESCVVCGSPDLLERAARLSFSPSAGGVLCPKCEMGQRDRRPISRPALESLRRLSRSDSPAGEDMPKGLHTELRQCLGHWVSFVLGRRPRLLSYVS
jgi:DNA repair protein RecO (recombination protein O)